MQSSPPRDRIAPPRIGPASSSDGRLQAEGLMLPGTAFSPVIDRSARDCMLPAVITKELSRPGLFRNHPALRRSMPTKVKPS